MNARSDSRNGGKGGAGNKKTPNPGKKKDNKPKPKKEPPKKPTNGKGNRWNSERFNI